MCKTLNSKYDRNFDVANTTTISGCPTNQCNPTINISNNRFTNGQGYSYDLSGNIINDAEGRTFIYDANNQQKEVKNSSNQVVGTYTYDGDGKRVKKNNAITQETTTFVYNAWGYLVAEYSTLAPQTTPTTKYLTSDHLGSPRVITNQTGAVESRRDFAPFGEELYTGTGNRQTGHGYTYGDSTSQKFTGFERDEETDLDFAQARYNSSQVGRFTSPDPLMASANVASPQTWNRYSYVLNNPMNLVDPTGMLAGCPPDKPNCLEDRHGGDDPSVDDGEIITVHTEIDCGGDGKCDKKDDSISTPTVAGSLGGVGTLSRPLISGGSKVLSKVGVRIVGGVAVFSGTGGAVCLVVLAGYCIATEPERMAGYNCVFRSDPMGAGCTDFNTQNIFNKKAGDKSSSANAKNGGNSGAKTSRNPNDEKPTIPKDKDLDRVDDKEIKKFKKNGVDIHDHKPNSTFDLFKDRKTGNVYVLPKNGRGTPEPTNLTTDGYRDMSLDN